MKIKVKIIEAKEITTAEGRKFLAFKTVDKNGKKMDVRFTKDCRNTPREACVIVVDDSQANVDTARQYPCLWIKDVERIEPLERKSNMADFFEADNEEDFSDGVTL